MSKRKASCVTIVVQQACRMFIPDVTIPLTPSPPWFNGEIRHHLNKLRSSRRYHLRRATPHSMAKLLRLETTLGELITRSKEKYIAALVDNFSFEPKKLYGYLRNLHKPLVSRTFIGTSSELVSAADDVAVAFNEYFHSTFTQSVYTLPPIDSLPSPPMQLHSIDIDQHDVYEALVKLDIRKAMGPDNTSLRVLKTCACALCQPLSTLFQECISQGLLPTIWKVHKITPIPKNSSTSHIANYRPISLLCIPSKVLESIIYLKIIEFVRPCLSVKQFGFLSGRYYSVIRRLCRLLRMAILWMCCTWISAKPLTLFHMRSSYSSFGD